MKPRWLDIRIRAKTDAPLKLVRNVYKLNRQILDAEYLNDFDIEVYRATVKVVKEGR